MRERRVRGGRKTPPNPDEMFLRPLFGSCGPIHWSEPRHRCPRIWCRFQARAPPCSGCFFAEKQYTTKCCKCCSLPLAISPQGSSDHGFKFPNRLLRGSGHMNADGRPSTTQHGFEISQRQSKHKIAKRIPRSWNFDFFRRIASNHQVETPAGSSFITLSYQMQIPGAVHQWNG